MLTFRGDAWLTKYPDPGKRVRHDDELLGWWFEVADGDHIVGADEMIEQSPEVEEVSESME